MTKDEKKYVLQKLKRAAVIAASAVTGLTAGGCGTNNKKDDAVANNDIVFVEEQTEATTPVDTIETTTTLSPLNKDSNRKKSYDDDSVDSEYVETSYENDFTTPTTITSIKNSNKKDVVDDNTTAKTNSKTNTTTAKTNEKNPNTKIETNTKNPTTTARTNEKNPSTTKTTTKATTKPTTKPTTAKTTTIVTTTTTEAVTEPPVTEPQEPEYIDYSDKGLIATNKGAFDSFSSKMLDDILANSGYENSFVSINVGYGNTFMGSECMMVLQSLNYNYINEEVIGHEFRGYSYDRLDNYKFFLYSFKDVLETFNGDLDFTQYTLDDNVGNFLNEADQAYRDGLFDDFMIDRIVNGNVSQEILSNPGVMAILYSYDEGVYLDFDDIDIMLSNNVNYISGISQGYSYSK